MNVRELDTVADLLDRLQARYAAKLVRRLHAKLKAVSARQWSELHQTAFAACDEVVGSLRRFGSISPECYSKLGSLQEETTAILKERLSVLLDAALLGRDFSYLRALHSLGILTWYENEGTLTFFTAPALMLPMLRHVSGMDDNALRKHCEAVCRLRAPVLEPESLNIAVENNFSHVVEFVRDFRQEALEHVKQLLHIHIDTARFENVASVEFLPTSMDFYLAGERYYSRCPQEAAPKHFIFSMTSGIMMAQEYYGRAYLDEMLGLQLADGSTLGSLCDRNPAREKYFRALLEANSRMPLTYYFASESTGKSFRKVYKALEKMDRGLAAKYLRDSIEILDMFLDNPRFSLVRMNDLPPVFKNLTLGNGREAVLSMRGGQFRIAHGLHLKPRPSHVRKAATGHGLRDTLKSVAADLLPNPTPLGIIYAFTRGFGGLLWYVVFRKRGEKEARDSLFDISRRIRREMQEFEVIKAIGKRPRRSARQVVEQLLVEPS